MIQKETILWSMDNSGARWVQCIHLCKVKLRAYASAGELILLSVKSCKRDAKFSKGSKHVGVITQVSKNAVRRGGESVFFSRNALVLVKAGVTPVGTRILGPVCLELRLFGHLRVISLALFTV